jgi:ribosome biogenesis GTPase
MNLESLGWAAPFATAFAALPLSDELVPARVAASQREHYRLLAEDGAYDATLSGQLRHRALPGELPVVGDWVAARVAPGERRATIAACLPRKTELARKQVGRAAEAQVLAANLDCALLVTALSRDFNPRRIERTLALIWEGGAQPVLILSKLDLCAEPERYVAEAEAVALGVPVHALSAQSGAGLDALERYLQPARTLALIGSSGVGKSTLLNRLLGREQAATQDIRANDERGRHTTTARELYPLPSGALLIDTPGVRELGLLDAEQGLAAAFDDIEALMQDCRFTDCGHGNEPGCALRAALADGTLTRARWESYEKLKRELAHEARRADPQARSAYQREVRQVMKQRKAALRERKPHRYR